VDRRPRGWWDDVDTVDHESGGDVEWRHERVAGDGTKTIGMRGDGTHGRTSGRVIREEEGADATSWRGDERGA